MSWAAGLLYKDIFRKRHIVRCRPIKLFLFVCQKPENRWVKQRYIIHTIHRCIKVNLGVEGPQNSQLPKNWHEKILRIMQVTMTLRMTLKRTMTMLEMLTRGRRSEERDFTRGRGQPGIAAAVDNIPYRCHHVICTHLLCTFYILLIKSWIAASSVICTDMHDIVQCTCV